MFWYVPWFSELQEYHVKWIIQLNFANQLL